MEGRQIIFSFNCLKSKHKMLICDDLYWFSIFFFSKSFPNLPHRPVSGSCSRLLTVILAPQCQSAQLCIVCLVKVQWLLLLHCADKVARCIVLDVSDRYTLLGWSTDTHIRIHTARAFGLFSFGFYCWFLTVFGKKVKGCLLFTESSCVCFLAQCM